MSFARALRCSNASLSPTRFGRRAIGRGSYVRADANDLRGAGEVRGALPVQPARDSRRFSDRNVNARAFPQTNDNARFFRADHSQAQAGANPMTEQVALGVLSIMPPYGPARRARLAAVAT